MVWTFVIPTGIGCPFDCSILVALSSYPQERSKGFFPAKAQAHHKQGHDQTWFSTFLMSLRSSQLREWAFHPLKYMASGECHVFFSICKRKEREIFTDSVCFVNLICTPAPLEHGAGISGERDVKKRPSGLAVNKLDLIDIHFIEKEFSKSYYDLQLWLNAPLES